MIDICEFGLGTLDANVASQFEGAGLLVLAPQEKVVWTGVGQVAAEDAKAASGHEKFRTLWHSPEPATLTLTSDRLVYDVRTFTRANENWPVGAGLTEAVIYGMGAARAHAQRVGRTIAGQMRHLQVADLITGAASRPTLSSASKITATLIQAPIGSLQWR
jgi:hypothetical protein